MNNTYDPIPSCVLHWNYRGFTEFPIRELEGEESEVTDIYLKENLISSLPSSISKLENLESLYLSGNDITELPNEISKLVNLKCLDLSGNRLRRIPEDIGWMKRLKYLMLDENELLELPLRLAELTSLRYLSVCDNKLRWLPQRPVYNYHHCEFRYWRNNDLKTIPYSLWYHMFRNQQTRSLNIGCLNIPKYQHISNNHRCRLKLTNQSREWDFDVDCPDSHKTIFESSITSPASLFELCRRSLYKTIADAAKKISNCDYPFYKEHNSYKDQENVEYLSHINGFQDISIDGNGNRITDLNQNNVQTDFRQTNCFVSCNKLRRDRSYVPIELVEEYFSFLPRFMKEELGNGPVSKCENVICKNPVFDYVVYEFCLGKIVLIDNFKMVILSAAFCSKRCADLWKASKSDTLTWSLVNQ